LAKYWPTLTKIDGQATAQALRELSPQAELFHFSGHGWATADLGGIHLADGVLTPLTPLQLRKTKLAVLSACFTAAGTNTGLANPDSLVQSLLDAGAGMVLASRWAIDSAATRRWMAVFYAELAQRATPAAALRKANEAMRNEHPYYWAAFQLYR
jgi:CHAT domain-containing protein